MKVLHVITSLRIGGAEKLLTELVPALIEGGIEAEIAVLDSTETPLSQALGAMGIKVHALGNKYRDIYNPLKIRGLRRLMRDFDIVHTHNTTPQFFAAWASRSLKDVPLLVTTEHNTKNRRRRWHWFGGLDRSMYGRYSRIACVNEAVRDSLLAHLDGRLADRMAVINNGIDVAAYADAAPSDELRRLLPGKRIAAMVAAMRPQKDHETLLRALALLPDDYGLVLAGDGQTRPRLESLAQELGIADRTAFLGFRTDTAAIYKSADVIVQATHYEGMSLSLIEAMASGRPYIASDVDGVSEVAKGAAVLVPEGDSAALAQAIEQMCSDPDAAALTVQACQQRARQYDISNTIDSYIRLYQDLRPERNH